jgi:hypothetical protein
MITVELKKVADCRGLIGTKPRREDYDVLVDEPTRFVDEQGKVQAIYTSLPSDLAHLSRLVAQSTKATRTWRTRGLPQVSSVFGAVPRLPVRGRTRCTAATRNKSEPANLARMAALAERLSEVYRELMPEQHARDLETCRSSVNGDYLLGGLPFTTFNANVNQVIKYHTDTGNFRGVLSNVLISRHGCAGGELVFPEYRFALAQRDGFLSIFDGQKEVHGVADVRLVAKDAYRASLVFYTLEQMRHCRPYLEEIERNALVNTQRNANRAKTFDMDVKAFVSGKWKNNDI